MGSRAFAQPASDVRVSELLRDIQKGINAANAEISGLQMPPFDSVTLQLQTEGTVGGTGGVNLWFIKISGGASKDTSSQMTLMLKPPKAGKSPTAAVALSKTIQ
jgi:hypothetical protein